MRSFREVGHLSVVRPGRRNARRIGEVRHILVAPDTKRVVGFEVSRPDVAMMIERKPRFLALDRCRITSSRVTVLDGRDAWDSAAARRLGVEWERTVVWRNMPVRTESGENLGRLSDAVFDEESGDIGAIRLSGGAVADSAVGVRDVEGSMIRGFDGQAVIVADAALEAALSGGAAERAGTTAAAASVMTGEVVSAARDGASELAETAAKAARTAAVYGKSAAKVAASSAPGKKAIGWLKAIRDEVTEAMADDDEER